MKTMIARISAGIFFACLTTTSIQAGNPIWGNTTGDNMWNTTANWAANPAGSAVTDIFNANSPATVVPGWPNGTIFFNANFTCGRFRSGGPGRLVTIASTNLNDATFTLSGGSAELIDGAGMTADWTLDGAANGNGAKLKLSVGGFKPITINTGRTMSLNLDVSGLGGYSKTGVGTLVVGGSNTYSSQSIVETGILKMGHPQALGFGGYNSGTNVPATVVSTIGVIAINVTAGGSGYTTVPTVTISGGGGGGATATAVTNSGAVTAITMTAVGTNYYGVPTVAITGGGGSGATADAVIGSPAATLDLGGQAGINEILILHGNGFPGTNGALINSSGAAATLASGVFSSLSVTAGGGDFSYPTTISITGGGGSGAAATASLGLTTASITITNNGLNYTAPPTVTITGGGGSGAKAVSQIDTNATQVVGVTITDPGSGYTNAPTVTFSGGGGTDAGASADADHFTVVGTILTAAGSGYTSQPTIDFSGGAGGAATAVANIPVVVLATNSSIGGNGPITINPVVSGGGTLTKHGAGVLTLNAANTYSGGTIINQGTLLANNTSGSGTGPGAITVNGGTLGGNGTVSGAVTGNTGGSIGAGSSAGILTLAGGLNLSGGGTNVWELAALKDDSDGVGGTDFDQVALTGGVLDLSGDSRLLVKFIGDTAPYSTNTFWQANHTWTIVTLTGGASNPTNLPFAAIPNAIFNAGTFSNYVGTGGKIMLTFTTNAPSKPVITSQPQNTTTNWGKPASFNVTAFGTDPEHYQWYFQNESGLIGGATASGYTNAGVQPADAGDYFVIITNAYGSATSSVAVLTVVITPPATIEPLVGAGTTNVEVSWSSIVGATYELQYNTNLNATNWYAITNLAGTGASLTVTNRPPAGEFQRYYRVVAQ